MQFSRLTKNSRQKVNHSGQVSKSVAADPASFFSNDCEAVQFESSCSPDIFAAGTPA